MAELHSALCWRVPQLFPPPDSVRGIVEQCAATTYQSFSTVASPLPPLRAAWIAVQDGQFSFAEACTTIITSENCSVSLDEWCVAHDLLMEAVKRGDIPRERHYGGADFHWHSELYQHCAKLAMGERCIKFVKSKFKEAENAGVIAVGQGESFINTLGIRQDMDKDNQFLVHAVYQLFLRQAEMDVRLREVFHYIDVQKRMALVNALVTICIPVGGSAATSLVSGGAVILESVQVAGLVQSLLGVVQGATGGFGTNWALNRVLRKTNQVLSVEEWSKQPEEIRKVVEVAASNLGLTIEELREKLLLVEEMDSSHDGETLSEQVIIEEVDEDGQERDVDEEIEASVPSVDLSLENVSLPLEGGTVFDSGATGLGVGSSTEPSEIRDELERFRGIGVSRDAVECMRSSEVAACVAAYVVKYELELAGTYKAYKDVLVKQFVSTCTFGDTFTRANGKYKEQVVEVVMTALAKVTDEKLLGPAEMRVIQFVQLTTT